MIGNYTNNRGLSIPTSRMEKLFKGTDITEGEAINFLGIKRTNTKGYMIYFMEHIDVMDKWYIVKEKENDSSD